MTTLSGPVGLRNGVTPVTNAPADQGKVIGLLWGTDPANGGMQGVSSPPSAAAPKQCAPALVAAITAFQAYWVSRGEFRVVDSVVDPRGHTLRKLDSLVGRVAPAPPPAPSFTELKVLRFQQTLPGGQIGDSTASIVPASVMPFLFTPTAKHAALTESAAKGSVSEFLFKIEKNGAIFWVGACVPAGTADFSRAYVFFHPATISVSDDAAYPGFAGRWPVVRRYVSMQGLQMAAIKPMPLIVPFMTHASCTNDPRSNLFADRGVETLNDILSAIQISLGQTGTPGLVQQVGVASFSSGIDHLFRFAEKLGGTGIIREQIDFDSAFIVKAYHHKHMPNLAGAVNWMVSQVPPPAGKRLGWLHLPANAFRKVHSYSESTHAQIGYMMFQTMMMLSCMR